MEKAHEASVWFRAEADRKKAKVFGQPVMGNNQSPPKYQDEGELEGRAWWVYHSPDHCAP